MRLKLRVSHEFPTKSGVQTRLPFTFHSLPHPYFCVLGIWRHRFTVTRVPMVRNRFLLRLNYLH